MYENSTSKISINVDRVATGGSCIGQAEDGRVVFVRSTIPGESVVAQIDTDLPRRIEASCVSVAEPSDHRIDPTCKHVFDGCGGCDWQHVEATYQNELRVQIVQDCLVRIGKFSDTDFVSTTNHLPDHNYRTTIRLALNNGKPAMRAHKSDDLVNIDTCGIAHPLVNDIIEDSNFAAAQEVTIRVGVNTGERLVVASPNKDSVSVPSDVLLVGSDELSDGKRVFYHEKIMDQIFRISATSFFQARPDGAEQLVKLVQAEIPIDSKKILDAYCGVGLFGRFVSNKNNIVIGVENNPSAVADAKINYHSKDKVVKSSLHNWKPSNFDVVIADPARTGLKAVGANKIVATKASTVILISCDPASLARDARLLCDKGYQIKKVQVLNIFGQTSHVETVTTLTK